MGGRILIRRTSDRIVVWVGLTLGLLAPVVAIEPPFEMEEVSEGIYAVRRKFAVSNAAVIVNDRDVVVIDSHVSPAGARGTLAAIRGITDKPVRYVINTHWHTDHFVGNEAYVGAFPGQVEFISHETAREDMPVLAPEQLPIAVRYVREDLEMATTMLLSGKDEHDQPLTAQQKERLARFVDDRQRANTFEAAREFVPDAIGRAYLELTGRLD